MAGVGAFFRSFAAHRKVSLGNGRPLGRSEHPMHAAVNKNVDAKVARGFGEEWSKFRQDETSFGRGQREAIFEDYFRIFPWHLLPQDGGVGADVGCGTGRWATMVAPRAAHLHLVDISPAALAVARDNLKSI